MEYDVAIIGGGPAGSMAATMLARKGRKVIVLEREKFPRFHIGESLLPYSMTALDTLGIREKVAQIGVLKLGGEIATTCGARSVKFHFKNAYQPKHKCAYHVPRAEFDKLLLDTAAEAGAEIREEIGVEKIAISDRDVTLNLSDGASLTAKYVIDCSGRNSVIGTHFGLKKSYPHLRKFSVYAHYENVWREEGEDGPALTRLIRGKDNWFWMIPISDTCTSVGIVTDVELFKQLKKSPEQFLDDAIRNQPLMHERMADAKLISPVRTTGEYSYRNTQLAGERWLLAGDAAGFIDPVFSTGVFIALTSGEQAADCIDAALQGAPDAQKKFYAYAKNLNRVMDMYVRFVSKWYNDEFIEVFTTPTTRFNLVPAINSMLAGNVAKNFMIRSRLEFFYFIIWLQKRIPLCKRLNLPSAAQPFSA